MTRGRLGAGAEGLPAERPEDAPKEELGLLLLLVEEWELGDLEYDERLPEELEEREEEEREEEEL